MLHCYHHKLQISHYTLSRGPSVLTGVPDAPAPPCTVGPGGVVCVALEGSLGAHRATVASDRNKRSSETLELNILTLTCRYSKGILCLTECTCCCKLQGSPMREEYQNYQIY